MKSADQVYNALAKRADDRGYCRLTRSDLVSLTSFSLATVRRAIDELVDAGRIQRRSKGGPAGGLLIRLITGSQPAHNPAQNEPERHVVKALPAPKEQEQEERRYPAQNPAHSRQPAHRPALHHETPDSGAELVYTGKQESTQWRRLGATLWQAPNGDAVSIRSMTPELRLRLRVDLNEDGTQCLEAVRALQGMLA